MFEYALSHLQTKGAYLPERLVEPGFFLTALAALTLGVAVRYFLAVSPFYFYLWKIGASKRFEKLHSLSPARGQIKNEIQWSLLSSGIFALSALALGALWMMGAAKIYTGFFDYPLWYMPLSFLILSLAHELYFYWTHVWMHRPKIFKKVHRVHHQSVNATPWASFSFHPWEAAVHAAFLPLFALIIPLHPLVMLAYLALMTITAISNHSGFELLTQKWARSIFISGSHHHAHHKNMKANFGLYFTFSDKLFGTEEKSFE